MRKITIEEWRKKRGEMLLNSQRLSLDRASKNRLRDSEERQILFQMDEARKSRWQAEKLLVKIAPRRYRLKKDK